MSGIGPVAGALRSTLRIAGDPRSMTALWKRADAGTWVRRMDVRLHVTDAVIGSGGRVNAGCDFRDEAATGRTDLFIWCAGSAVY